MVKIFDNTYNDYEKVFNALGYYAVNNYNIFSIAKNKTEQEQLIWFLVEFKNILRRFLSLQPFSMEFSNLSDNLLQIYLNFYKNESNLPDSIRDEITQVFNKIKITQRIINNESHLLDINMYLSNLFINEIESLKKKYDRQYSSQNTEEKLSRIFQRRGLDRDREFESFFKSGEFLCLSYSKIEELFENQETKRYLLNNFKDLFVKYSVKKFLVDKIEPDWEILNTELVEKVRSEIHNVLLEDNNIFQFLNSLEQFNLEKAKKFIDAIKYTEYPFYPIYDISLITDKMVDNLNKIINTMVSKIEYLYKDKKNSNFDLWSMFEFKVMIFLSGFRFHYKFNKMV